MNNQAAAQGAAHSSHPGGVYVALADGSIRFIANRIDTIIWRAYGTRDLRETANLE